MPFGLTNGPSTYQSLMNEIFKIYLHKFILVFFDNILIYSKSWDEHMKHLDITLNISKTNQLFVKKEKCTFAQQEVKYLGHVITTKGVAANSEKIVAIMA